MTRQLLTGNGAAALAARLARIDYIPAFPITPQTEIIETLSSWIEKGELDAAFTMLESEHSMITAAGAAASAGARVFTASSSQGLLYGMEMIFALPGWRVPLVMVNVSRGLPSFDPMTIQFKAGRPVSQAAAVLGGSAYSYFRYETHLASLAALRVHELVCGDFERIFNRKYSLIEEYRNEDAEISFVMIGSFATKAMDAVDALRDAGKKIGLVRPRMIRPFPAEALRKALGNKQACAVIDQNLSFGKGGILHTEIASALYGLKNPPMLASFVGGLGGRDISAEEFFEIESETRSAHASGSAPPPRLLFTEEELREIRKLQKIANSQAKL